MKISEHEIHPAAGERRPLGIYLHIPFCKRKCLYCDFLSAWAPQEVIERYVDALCYQLAQEAPAYQGHFVRTVFFGGGTPSLLSELSVEKIMAQIRKYYVLAEGAEITLEANPGTLEPLKLEGYRRAGIDRLSMGLQSASDAELKALGRIHSFGDFLQNYEAARRAGFDNINVDLMSALPGQTPKGWRETLQRVASLAPEHISAYSLIIEEGTPFYERYGEKDAGSEREDGCAVGKSAGKDAPAPGFLPLPSEEEERLMYEETQEILRWYGYHRYEISNYAKPGKECLHNIGYWDRTDYAGFGLGAASLVDNVRWRITDDLEEYLRIFGREGGRQAFVTDADDRKKQRAFVTDVDDRHRTACGGRQADDGKRERQALSKAEQMEEFLFLGLRLTAGISLPEFRRQFGAGLREIYGKVLERLEHDELIVFYEDGKKMKLTPKGVDVSNYVLAQFLLDEG